jgi:hypothetical protein
MRKDVRNDRRDIGLHWMNPEQQEGERRQQHDQPRNAEKEMEHGVEVVQTLPEG